MNYVQIGDWCLRTDRITAVHRNLSAKCVDVYCGLNKECSTYFKNRQETEAAYQKLLKEIFEAEGVDKIRKV